MSKAINLVLAFLFLIITISSPSNVFACCAKEPSIEEEIETSEAIFAGKVIGVKEERDLNVHTSPFELFPVKEKILFEVSKTWKGVSQSQIIIATEISSIGYQFKIGNEYLVYANRLNSNQLETHICDSTKEIALAEEDLTVLGEGEQPIEDINLEDKFNSNPLYSGLIIVGILIAIIFFTRRRMKR